ncbi:MULTISPECIES: hypothetical protein [Actinomadura]|uniref:Uncharacterized protein n=1 Tax=Actinomadura yumaensis TaxID=111807 RepID=A0ABW2CU31_9ACTN|nr:hypothetical protein [Actinomadura sp. J1-007]MWK39571.1 hypothetical protein [Actinomadura sp. J1-007]
MARIPLAATRPARGGVTAVAEVDGNTVDGHVVTNTGRTVITVRNADASNPHSVTFVLPQTIDGQAVADRVVSIPASATRTFGGFVTEWYSQRLSIDVDSTQLKLQALEP